MLVIVLILQILIFFGIAGTHSRISEIEQRLRLKGSFLDDEADKAFGKPDFLETPQTRIKKPRKIAVKQATTLKKGASAKTQKRGANGRFA